MTPEERRRWETGREDWRESQWQDHCGDPYCDTCGPPISIPSDPVLAKRRAAFEASILGAMVELL